MAKEVIANNFRRDLAGQSCVIPTINGMKFWVDSTIKSCSNLKKNSIVYKKC